LVYFGRAGTVAAGGFANEVDGLVDIERFWQVFERTALVGGNGVFQVGMRGDDDDRQVGSTATQTLEQGKAAHAGHANIGDQHVWIALANCVQQVFRALEAARLHIGLLERFLEHPAHRLVIVNYPDR
jgi:hypothetical protein